MKKLIIAVAIVCAAAFAQATTFNWGNMSYDIYGPEGYVDDLGYLLDGYATLTVGSDVVVDHASMTDYRFGSFDNTSTTDKSVVQSLARGDISESFVGQAYKLVITTTDEKYQVVLSGISGYDIDTNVPLGEPAYNYESFTMDTPIAAGDWQSVPEPTSGLLLLLGVAGLALRRGRRS